MGTFVGIGDRLREQRSALGLTQTQFAELLGCSKNTQSNYEKDERSPDASYLQTLMERGVDVMYILSGETSASHLSAEESNLLKLFRSNPPVLRAAAMRVLFGAAHVAGDQEKASTGLTIQGNASGQINSAPVTNTAKTMSFGTTKE